MPTELLVTDILRCSLNDGPGIRTTVFVKGCPLRCAWCHNPETQSGRIQIWFDESRCTFCGGCATACSSAVHTTADHRHDVVHHRCQACGKCSQVCPANALRLIGSHWMPEKILDVVVRDKAFYERSGGGVTVSGGEPMAQFAGTLELLRLARSAGIHTCLDTCGQASIDNFHAVLPYVDLFLWDYKATGASLHRQLTGIDGGLILTNLRALYSQGAKIRLRCPMIPGMNDGAEHLQAIARMSQEMPNLDGIDLMPYHAFGRGKARRIGMDQSALPDNNAEDGMAAEWLKQLSSLGCSRATLG